MKHRLLRNTLLLFLCLFFVLMDIDLWAQKSINANDFAQWKKCFINQMSLWDGGVSFCLETGKAMTNEIFITNLYYYSYIHRLGPTNVIRCPSGVPYRQSFTLQSGPYCSVHPITGVDLINQFVMSKTIPRTHKDLIGLLQQKNPTGARRYALMHMDMGEEAKSHEADLRRILMQALADDDRIIRFIAMDKIKFWKEKIPWLITLTDTNSEESVRDTHGSGSRRVCP